MITLGQLSIRLPIVGAPMAGVSTPQLAAAVSRAGGLGSIAIGASNLVTATEAINETRRLVGPLPFAVNVFCHPSARPDALRESEWLDALRSRFESYGAEPPKKLEAIYKTFDEDSDMVDLLVSARVPAVSFHFGLPSPSTLGRLRGSGATLMATATNLGEAQEIQRAGLDVIIAQGYEAGGHRGTFHPEARDEKLGTLALTRLLVKHTNLPIIAAGGIMDGAGVACVLRLGAIAAQVGTAFVASPESAASDSYKADLLRARGTEMVSVISGRPARTILNRWTEGTDARGEDLKQPLPVPPDYPIAYDAGKQLHAAAMRKGEHGYGAQWAGQGVALARAMPAGELMRYLEEELHAEHWGKN
jgi:nitronate monooxygenase